MRVVYRGARTGIEAQAIEHTRIPFDLVRFGAVALVLATRGEAAQAAAGRASSQTHP
jgi:hypothetical protein